MQLDQVRLEYLAVIMIGSPGLTWHGHRTRQGHPMMCAQFFEQGVVLDSLH